MQFKFTPPWFKCISLKTLLEIRCLINDDDFWIDIGITICNFDIITLYVDNWKTSLGLLGCLFQIWYNQDEK